MGTREFPFEKTAKCDRCQKQGAFDIYGDYLCGGCLSPADEEVDEEYRNDEHETEGR